MEVAARGDGALVAELGLDYGEGVALTCELRRMGVSEAVGMHALFDPRLAGEAREERTEVSILHRSALERAEDRRWAADPEVPASVQPAFEEGERARVETYGPRAVPLAMENPDRTSRSVEVFGGQGKRLPDPEAAAVEGGNHGAVPDPCRCLRRARAQQAADLVLGEDLGGIAA